MDSAAQGGGGGATAAMALGFGAVVAVNAPVHLFQGTGVTSAEVKFLTQLTCSLKDNMVNRPVLGHGSLV